MTQPPQDPDEPIGGALTPQPEDQPEPTDEAPEAAAAPPPPSEPSPPPAAEPPSPPPPYTPPAAGPPPPSSGGFPPPPPSSPSYPPPSAGSYPPPPSSGGFPPPPPPGGQYPPPGAPYGQSAAFPPPPGPGSAFPPGGGYPGGAKPNNFLVPAILATIFCCLPLGIVAIVKAAKVDGLFQSGQYAAAAQAAADAKKWTFWSIGLGVGILVVYFLFAVLAAGMGSSGY